MINSNKKTLIIFSIIAILFLVVFLKKDSNDSPDALLKKKGISLEDIQGFKIEAKDKEKLTLKNENEVLRINFIKNMDEKKAKQYGEGQLALIESQYEPQPVPYPEFITNSKDCAEKFKPVKKEYAFGDYELLFAGERFSFGACSDDLIKYKASLGYFYCEKRKTLYKLEYFIPKEESTEKLENLTRSFRCL